VRKDEELFVSDAFDNNVGHLLGFESAVGQEVVAEAPLSRKHVGLHALRAKAGHANSIVAVGDREPLEERERRGLGHAVRSREDVV
jgi:hypothetical protein